MGEGSREGSPATGAEPPQRQRKQRRPSITPREIAVTCARLADAKKAHDILILDLRRLLFLTDYFVIATCDNSMQLRAITDDIERRLGEAGLKPLNVAGRGEARWVLIDYVDVVVHLFLPEARAYYDLELLWGDAPKARWRVPVRRRPSASPGGAEPAEGRPSPPA